MHAQVVGSFSSSPLHASCDRQIGHRETRMGMGDEPWDTLRPRRKQAEPTTLTPVEALKKFGSLQEKTRDGLFEVDCYLEFDRPEGLWIPQFDFSKQFTGYRLRRRRNGE